MHNFIFIYDNSLLPSKPIQSIVGCRRFSEISIRQTTVWNELNQWLTGMLPHKSIFEISCHADWDKLLDKLQQVPDMPIALFNSFVFVASPEKASRQLIKCEFIAESYIAKLNNKTAYIMFNDRGKFEQFVRNGKALPDGFNEILLDEDEFIDLDELSGFMRCVTEKYDTRFFNLLSGDQFTLKKTSTNKEKIKAEYKFWHLLPDKMKPWFVMPYEYNETLQDASYCMKRLHIPNLALKYTHGGMDEAEFKDLMVLYMRFIEDRCCRQISSEESRLMAHKLYYDKVKNRLDEFKRHPRFADIAALVKHSCGYDFPDEIFEEYHLLLEKVRDGAQPPHCAVIGHGDPGFSNALFDHDTRTLLFIDPKGALTEEELWTDPYYDLAKISHSVCGHYDFICRSNYEIVMDGQMRLQLKISFDNSLFADFFRQHIELSGYDFWLVRICEASLFLSMLPLHAEAPERTLAFILNIINILDEVRNNV